MEQTFNFWPEKNIFQLKEKLSGEKLKNFRRFVRDTSSTATLRSTEKQQQQIVYSLRFLSLPKEKYFIHCSRFGKRKAVSRLDACEWVNEISCLRLLVPLMAMHDNRAHSLRYSNDVSPYACSFVVAVSRRSKHKNWSSRDRGCAGKEQISTLACHQQISLFNCLTFQMWMMRNWIWIFQEFGAVLRFVSDKLVCPFIVLTYSHPFTSAKPPPSVKINLIFI